MSRLELFVDAVKVDRVDVQAFGQAHVTSVEGRSYVNCTLDGKHHVEFEWTALGLALPQPGDRLVLEIPGTDEL